MFVQTGCLKRVLLGSFARGRVSPPRFYSSSPPGTSNAPSSSLISYNAQLFSHFSHKQLEKAEKLIEEMQQNGVEPDVISWKTLLLMYRTCEKKEEAKKVEDLLKAKGLDTVTLWRLTEYLQEQQGQQPDKLEDREQTSEDEPGQPDLLTLNTLIGLYAEMDHTAAVESALATLRSLSYTPNMDTYHPLVLMYCRLKEDKRVRELIEDMEAKSLYPNAKMYNAMMLMYGKMGLYAQLNQVATQFAGMRGRVVQEAEVDLLKSEKTGERKSESEKKQNSKEVAAYATLVELYVKLYKADEAEAVIRQMAETGVLDTIHVASYNSLVSLYSRLGDSEKANQILMHMSQHNISPNLVTKILMHHFGKLEDYSSDIQMEEKEGCYNLLAVTYAKLGKLEQVLEVVRDMSKCGIFVTEKTSQTIKAMVKEREVSEEKLELAKVEEQKEEEEPTEKDESNVKVNE